MAVHQYCESTPTNYVSYPNLLSKVVHEKACAVKYVNKKGLQVCNCDCEVKTVSRISHAL
uniref:Uncharacterized protein n=1 Tax=Arundo donax TaxID=35708 RepID=A0A0A9CX33_ARUDO